VVHLLMTKIHHQMESLIDNHYCGNHHQRDHHDVKFGLYIISIMILFVVAQKKRPPFCREIYFV